MPKVKATSKHPTYKRLEEIFIKMEDLGISISIDRYGVFTIRDKNIPDVEWELRDLEDDGESTASFVDLPPVLEYKLVKDV